MANGDSGHRPDGIVITKQALVPLGVVFAALLVAIPAAVRWGELTSDVRRLQSDLEVIKKDHDDDVKLHDIRLTRLETARGAITLQPSKPTRGNHDKTARGPDPTGAAVRPLREGANLLGEGHGGDPRGPFFVPGWSLDGGRGGALERISGPLHCGL